MKIVRTRCFWKAAAIVLVTLAAYVPAMRAGFLFDDDINLTESAALRTVPGVARIWFEPHSVLQYYPVTQTFLWIGYRFWKLDPAGYHLMNILFHAGTAVLLGAALRRLKVPGAWLAAMIFAVHPVQVETVAYASELKNILSSFFYFAAILAYLGFAEPEQESSPARRRWCYGLALVFFATALLSKTSVCTLPVALGLILWWKRGTLDWRRDIPPLLPLAAVAAVLAGLTIRVEQGAVGAHGPEWDYSWMERILIAGRAVWFYAWKLVWPADLCLNYPRWKIDATSWVQFLYPAAALGVVAVLGVRRNRWGRGPLTAVAWFILTLAPGLGLVSFYFMIFSYVADHFQYLACAGLIALFSAGLHGFCRGRAVLLPAVSAALILTLAVLTWRHAENFRDARTVWADTIQKNPESWLAHNNLGSLLLADGELDQAALHLQQSIRLNPNYEQAYQNLAGVVAARGRLSEAEVLYRKALEIRPAYARAHYNLGVVLARQGRVDEAIGHYRRAIECRSDYVDAYNNLGNLLAARGESASAMALFAEALALDPGHAAAHFNLARVLARTGRYPEAERHFREAVSLDPKLGGQPGGR